MFIPIVIKAEELGVRQKVQNVSVVSNIDGEITLIPYQVDEVNEKTQLYFEGDGIFAGKDEIVFFLNYCGSRILKDDIEEKVLAGSGQIFEVEVDGNFCYIVLGEIKQDIPKKREKFLEYQNSDDFIVMMPGRLAVFDNRRPLVKEIRIMVNGNMERVFQGMHADMEMKLLNLIKVRKNELDVGSKVVFLKGGDVRILRVVKPYLDIFAGIKIPTSESVTVIYPGYTIVYNTVMLCCKLKKIYKNFSVLNNIV